MIPSNAYPLANVVDISSSATRILREIDADLYERALALIDELLNELSQVGEIPVYVDVPEELLKAWRERSALAELMKDLCAQDEGSQREHLVKLYRERLVDADEYDGSIDAPAPEVSKALLEKADALFEEDRRARLLAS